MAPAKLTASVHHTHRVNTRADVDWKLNMAEVFTTTVTVQLGMRDASVHQGDLSKLELIVEQQWC